MPYKNSYDQADYLRQWIAIRRLAFFADKHCAICGSDEDLELDRIEPGQPANHRIWSYSDAKRFKALELYQALCHDCRVLRRRRWQAEHVRSCPNGHEYTVENTGYDKQGSRFCRMCHRLGERRRKARRKQQRASS